MSIKKLQEKIGSVADGIFGPNTLKAAAKYYDMTPERAAHFFGQLAHETADFKYFTENLNYSVSGLNRVFKKYFPNDLAESYARNPEKIGSRVYANRMGNGNEESKEGYMYRGRGAIQLTGKNNYTEFSKYMSDPEILTNPDIVADEYAFESAKFYFENNNLWKITDLGVDDITISKLTKRINGGYNGLEDRVAKTNKYYGWLTR